MIRRIDIKLILIASLGSVLLSMLIFPLVRTILHFITDIEFDLPLGIYLLRAYFPLLLAGLYVGFYAKKNVSINGVVVGIVYSFILDLISIIFLKGIINISWASMIYGPIQDGIVCGFVSWATFKINDLLKTKGHQNV